MLPYDDSDEDRGFDSRWVRIKSDHSNRLKRPCTGPVPVLAKPDLISWEDPPLAIWEEQVKWEVNPITPISVWELKTLSEVVLASKDMEYFVDAKNLVAIVTAEQETSELVS